MPVYLVTGKLGTGKSKWCARRAQQAIREGRRVASNMDFYLDKLNPRTPKARYMRIPDKPTVADLEAIGHGNPESYDEDRNGVLILDELGSWLNSRQSLDGPRKAVVDWMIHARKFGWDVLLIVQSAMMIDKQIREGIGEYLVSCYRLDKLKLPIIGWLLDLAHPGAGRLPRLHVAATKLQLGPGAAQVVDRDFFRGDDLHAGYDTRQAFVANPEAVTFTQLSPHYFNPPEQKKAWWRRLVAGVGAKRAPRLPGAAVRVWPKSVETLSPDLRWEVARRLFSASQAASRKVIPFPRPIARPNRGQTVLGDSGALPRIGRASA